MIVLKSPAEIALMRTANGIVAEVLQVLAERLCPGMTTLELDRMAEEAIRQRGAEPAFKGYQEYRYTLCTSVNSVVVHGLPDTSELAEGDIVSIDCGVRYQGWHGDHAWTFIVGDTTSPTARTLMRVTEEALLLGIDQMRIGQRLYDVSAAIQRHVEGHEFSIVRDYVGHGVGRALHEEPQVPNFGTPGTGPRLLAGMVLALEPMVNEGTAKVKLLPDGWTVVTADGKLSAHFEHSVAVTEQGPLILSKV
ncbi:MAG: type I methionyl aminopeptidase [Deltaproteobacteria bacterium]|nr:type I methionyl aminopeptidase [Deltaproteobacteria bacterium]